jgi:gliding motility-associated-like protein
MNQNSILSISSPGILGNDSDIDNDPLNAVLVSDVQHGTLVLYPSGSFSYTPTVGYSGVDSFTYRASDGSATSNIATVTITVNAVNQAPVAFNDSYTTNEDTPLSVPAPGVLSNDTDPENNNLTSILVTGVQHGTLTLNSNGSFTYTPSANYNGSDSFTYQASDGSLTSNVATVTITVNAVNDPPVAVNDNYSTDEDLVLSVAAPGILVNDTDVDGNTLTASLVQNVSFGTLSLAANGGFVYTPNLNYFGTDYFTYTVSDGVAVSNVATVTINIRSVNDAPVANANSYSTSEDVTLMVSSNGVLSNDTDVDNVRLYAVLGNSVANGMLTLNEDGTFTYIPNEDFNGTDNFTYRAFDGQLYSNYATVTITVNAVNDPPNVRDDEAFTSENTSVNINVLANDDDARDGSPGGINASTVAVTAQPQHGSVTRLSNNTFTYTPYSGFYGTDQFTYSVSDRGYPLPPLTRSATVTINVARLSPVANDDNVTIAEDTPIDINVTANDVDLDLNPASLSIISAPANGTATVVGTIVRYTPRQDYFGTDFFTYTVRDLANHISNVARVNITITPVPDPPVIRNSSFSTPENTALVIALSSIASDPENDIVPSTITFPTQPQHGTVSFASGNIRYQPASGYGGNDFFTVRVSDQTGLQSNIGEITIQVSNQSPDARDDNFTINEDNVGVFDVLANDTDPQNNINPSSLTIITAPVNGTAVVASGRINYTPNANFNGTDQLRYSISDNTGYSDQATVYITVLPVNDPPVAVNDVVTTPEDTPVDIYYLVNDYDVDNQIVPSSTIIVTAPTHGTAVLAGGGSVIRYTPALNYFGTDVIVYRIFDQAGASANGTINITITPVNDPPVAVDDEVELINETFKTFNPLANDSDPEGELDRGSLRITVNPEHGRATVATSTGLITYTPNAGFSGNDRLEYTVCDRQGLCASARVNIVVNRDNQPPVANNDQLLVNEDTPGVIFPLANDTDVNGNIDAGSLTIITAPSHGVAIINEADGSVEYTPSQDYFGSDSFVYRIYDLGNPPLSDTATVFITILPVNDSPVANDDMVVLFDNQRVTINVLDNDFDVEGDQLILQSIESHPLIVNEGNGVVVIQSDNIIHCGEFDIQYTVCDGQLCDDAVLTIVLHAFDSDSDGIPDYIEGMDDTDGDHIPDYLDLDSDNDGIPDSLEGGMNNECGRMPLDSDGDGIPDYLDSDSDNDGVLDSIEGIDDCDGDGIPNWRDAFDDCDVRPFIPELFTPNGDGVNDKFVIPEIEQYHGNELLIFNRWGVLVYHKVNYDNSWDGYANKNSSGNKLLPEDTYFYVFKTGIQNKVKKGTVYLKR